VNNLECSNIKVINPTYLGIFVGDTTTPMTDIKLSNIEMHIINTRHKRVGINVRALNAKNIDNVRISDCTIKRELEKGGHTGVGSSASLVDSSKTWIVDEWIGWTVLNVTDNSFGTITSNTSNTITATLADGTVNSWGNGDTYEFSMLNQVGFELKYCKNSHISNAIAIDCGIGITVQLDCENIEVSNPVVESKCPIGTGVEAGSATNISVTSPIVQGNGSLRLGMQASAEGGFVQTHLAISNASILNVRSAGIDINGQTGPMQMVSINGGVIRSESKAINIKESSNVVINDFMIDSGNTPIVLDKTVGVSISNIKHINTYNGNVISTIIRLFADITMVVDDIAVNNITIESGDGGAWGEFILNTSLSGGATLGEEIRSYNNSKGYEIIENTSGTSNLTTATVEHKRLSTPPTGASALNSVANGSFARTFSPASSGNIGLWVKESGTWVKK